MQQDIVIRDFDDFDPGAIYAIIRHIYLTSDFMSDEFDRQYGDVASFKTHFSNLIARRGSFVLVALLDQRPVGYLTLERRQETRLQHTAWLNMGLIENQRRKGIGSMLVESAMDRAAKEGLIEIVYLMVRADHTGAIGLYKKTGFEALVTLERDTKIDHEYYDGVLMRRFLHK
ncbi:MAG: N-acetyltransferase family protein [Bacteroidales bacterium]